MTLQEIKEQEMELTEDKKYPKMTIVKHNINDHKINAMH